METNVKCRHQAECCKHWYISRNIGQCRVRSSVNINLNAVNICYIFGNTVQLRVRASVEIKLNASNISMSLKILVKIKDRSIV